MVHIYSTCVEEVEEEKLQEMKLEEEQSLKAECHCVRFGECDW